MSQHVRVGVAVIIHRDGKVLVGQRKGSHGAGSWSVPGGHLDFGESLEDCAQREVFEETGLVIRDVLPCGDVTNDIFTEEGKHYITVWMQARLLDGQVPINREPDKCNGWEWHEWGTIPEPHFLPLAFMRNRYPLSL